MESKAADWIAWVLHFIAGAVAGALLGAAIVFRGEARHYGNPALVPNDLLTFYFIGATLIGAGLASLLGDKIWIGLNYRTIPPHGLHHSLTSKLVSVICMVVGAGLIAYSLACGWTA